MARPFSLVLSMGAALIMLGCGAKNNTPADSAPVPRGAPAVPAASRTAPAKAPAAALFEVVPAMRACLARGEAERAYANDVERRADGSVSMRLRYADATQFTCAVTFGSQVSKFEAVVEPSESLIETPAFALSAAAASPIP